MAMEGPAQGTSMGSMQALNTSSSVNGATTWFLSQRMSLKHSAQKHGSERREERNEHRMLWRFKKKKKKGVEVLTKCNSQPVHEGPGTVHGQLHEGAQE